MKGFFQNPDENHGSLSTTQENDQIQSAQMNFSPLLLKDLWIFLERYKPTLSKPLEYHFI
jgi:hypothetical protein